MKKIVHITLLSFVITCVVSCASTSKSENYLNKNYKELKRDFPEAQVSILKDSIKIIFPNNIMFNLGSSSLIPTFEEKLVRFAFLLNKYNKTNLLITGYTDNIGDVNSNMNLSLDRANAVKSKLLKEQVVETRMFTWGLGEKNPISSNDSEDGRKKNRRAEFIILYNPTNK